MSDKYKVECPVCKTDKYIIYDMGSHAGGPNILHSNENYFCDKCGGEFFVEYKIIDNKIKHLNIKYKDKRYKCEGSYTRA